jgi:acyl dehydratase
MALSSTFVGHRSAPTAPYHVSREKIAEFADAVGDPHPAYRSVTAARALGYADIIAPPTFMAVITDRAILLVTSDPDLRLESRRVVLGEQALMQTRPIVAGDLLRSPRWARLAATTCCSCAPTSPHPTESWWRPCAAPWSRAGQVPCDRTPTDRHSARR